MKNLVFLLAIALIIGFVFVNIMRARSVAARMGAEPNPMRVALMQREALVTALQFVDTSNEPTEIKEQRRQRIIEKHRNLETIAFS